MIGKLFISCLLPGFLAALSCSISNPSKTVIFIPPHVHSVYVFTFINETGVKGIQNKLRNALQNFILKSTKVSLSRDLRFADAVLQGSIKRLFIQEIDRTSAGWIDKARYCLILNFSLKDIVRNQVLMTNQTITAIQRIRLQTPPLDELVKVREQIVSNISHRIIRYCTTGERDDFNLMYGFEDKPLIDDDGTLVGRKRKNYDLNNDGIDDRLQKPQKSDGLTNIIINN